MKQFVDRLMSLDPAASDTLKVISYFDTLTATNVGIESLLRGAAILSGTAAGYRSGTRSTRVGPDGSRAPESGIEKDTWPTRAVQAGAFVWLERDGAPHANDAMVLERLALTVAIKEARRSPSDHGAIEIAVSAAASAEDRATALSRLRIDAEATVTAVALLADTPTPKSTPSAVIATTHGLVRVAILRHDGSESAWSATTRRGIGLSLPPDRLPESWSSAMIALRMSSKSSPAVHAGDFGILVLAAAASEDQAAAHPDVDALAQLSDRELQLLGAIAASSSIRGAAIKLGLHHKTLQKHVDALVVRLGYDPRSPMGRARYALARMLFALGTSRLGDPL